MKMTGIALGLAVAAMLATAPARAADKPLYQLRVYALHDASKPVFHARFRDHAMRIMKRHGFDIVATWEARRDGKPEFVYLLRWPDEATQKASWAAFMADAEWIAIKKATLSPDAPIMGEIEDRTMRLTDYSPPFP
ncbi:NIPSNAP family protein [Nostoc ellipsosporum NOK]|nr:NIPSNAP family protein [Nostoc ellipsosporum NOK]